MVVFQMADGDADPAFRAELPSNAIGVRQIEQAEMAWVLGLRFHPVDMSGDVGKLGVQGIAVAVS